MQDILGGDGFGANAAFGEGDIFGNLRIEMMADHEHIEMLGNCVDGVGASGIRRRWQNIRETRRCE